MKQIFFIFLIILDFRYKAIRMLVMADNSFYTAGVAEFRPNVGMSSADSLADHLRSYLNIIQSEEAYDTDIIVFPEGTLNDPLHLTYVPSEKDGVVPCLEKESKLYANFLVELSCAARRFRKYIVINLTEKENCPSNPGDPRPCADNGLNIFNTNVVFDREGRVVSRYRKVHIYVENKNTTNQPEFAIFDTDFDVRFGHFICFDILFYTPAQELVDRFGITDFIFTSLFYSELPFLTAVQLQHGWSWGNNVNLLAAGASYPQNGITGSGIYAGHRGDLISVMVSDEGERKLYKARVPKKGFKLNIDNTDAYARKTRPPTTTNIRLLKDKQIAKYNSVLVDLKQSGNFKQYLCQGDLCCRFEVNANIVNGSLSGSIMYRVGVFDGRRTYEKEEWSDIKVCALYACATDEVTTCGQFLAAENIMFKYISITGKFTKASKLMIMPSTLNDQLYPLRHEAVAWSKKEQKDFFEVDFSLNKAQSNILTFGIYGNYYEKSSAEGRVAANIIIFSFTCLGLLIFLNRL